MRFLMVLMLMVLPCLAKQPNVVFILTDDQRSDALGCAGHSHLKTPNIDRLAAEGVFFRNHFCTTSLCSPSRASILGGLYAHTHGVVNNFTDPCLIGGRSIPILRRRGCWILSGW
jgi:arylsulfatase A-like enzyme